MKDTTVLVVEDHDTLREGLQILLETEGFQVMSAVHGREALAQMQVLCPDLILSDISMPEMDGHEFYKAVQARPEWITIPFIFLTARGERDDMFASKKLGVEDYLVKPVDRSELVATIRSRLDRSEQLMLAQMQQAYEASLIMLANAIELRDYYTRGHVERVMNYTMIIARQMDWPASQMNVLQFGAILHDIGKIYIHENVLFKAGPLTDVEWSEMKRHPEIGAELLQNVPYLQDAIPIVRHHHERWDGAGYPDGLAGKDITLGARIVAVADSFDAITTSRVYHTAASVQKAYREIVANSESHYDPDVVKAFQAAWWQIGPLLLGKTISP
jgi:putative two-component system response regulator